MLPNLKNATIDIAKLKDYCLNPSHRRGKHKAKVFASTLGLSARNAQELRDTIYEAIRNNQATETKLDQYGQRYIVDFDMQRKSSRKVKIRTTWIIRYNEDFPRLTSCYIL